MKTINFFIASVMILNACNTPDKIFQRDLETHFVNADNNIPVMTDESIAHLPYAIQNYLYHCGYVGKEIPMNGELLWKNSRIKMKPDGKWLNLKTYQYNSVEKPFRIALMKARMAGIVPFDGRDIYHDGYASMLGKIMKGITVINANDKETAQSAAIVLLAEVLMVPGYIFQDYIYWEEVDSMTVKGTIENREIKAEALFHFNEKGEYIKFHTNDRNFDNGDGTCRKVPYSINIGEYRKIDHFITPTYVSAVWHLAEGDYEYWQGNIEKIKFNINLEKKY